jgi:hypothetical protein
MINENRYLNYFYILLLITLTTFIYYEIFYFEFNVIDEHQIVNLIGSDGYLQFQDFKDYISNTFLDIVNGKLRTTLINLYWPIETILFQNNSKFYYILRFIIINIFFISLFFSIKKYIGKNYSFILTLVFLVSSGIDDIFTRIIVPEFLTLFCLIFILPIFLKVSDTIYSNDIKYEISTKDIIVYTIFFSLLFFSKESLIPFIVVPIFFLYSFKKKNNLFNISNFLILLFFILYIYLNINLIINDTDTIKGVIDLNIGNLIRIFLKFSQYIFTTYFVHLLLLFYSIIRLKQFQQLKNIFLFIFLNSILIFYQFLIYNGNLPSGTRYDFLLNFLFFINSFYLIKIFQKKNLEIKNFKINNLFAIYLIFIFIIKMPSIIDIKQKIQNKKIQRDHFHSKILEIKSLINDNQQNIILRSFNVWDYELILSIFRYVRFYDIKNNIYLKLEFNENDINSDLEMIFYKRLKDVSQKKKLLWRKKENDDWGFENIQDLNSLNNCVELSILRNKLEIDKHCEKSIKYIYKTS